MTFSKRRYEELEEPLRDAVASVRETPIDESLVARCRQSAVQLRSASVTSMPGNDDSFFSWWVPLSLAASVLLLTNVMQAYMHLPSSNRELVAIHQNAEVKILYVYSDLTVELAVSQSTR